MRPPPSLGLVQALVHGSLRVEAAGTSEKNHAKCLRNSRELVEAAGVAPSGGREAAD